MPAKPHLKLVVFVPVLLRICFKYSKILYIDYIFPKAILCKIILYALLMHLQSVVAESLLKALFGNL